MATAIRNCLYICKCGTMQIRRLFGDEEFPEVLCSKCNKPMKNLLSEEVIQRLYEFLFPFD